MGKHYKTEPHVICIDNINEIKNVFSSYLRKLKNGKTKHMIVYLFKENNKISFGLKIYCISDNKMGICYYKFLTDDKAIYYDGIIKNNSIEILTLFLNNFLTIRDKIELNSYTFTDEFGRNYNVISVEDLIRQEKLKTINEINK